MKEYEKIVNKIIKEDCRKEAIEILSLSSEFNVLEFIKYHKDDKDNICCLHLDFLKSKLVESGKMKPDGQFGAPFLDKI